ncbi:MAG: hypothetical protein R2704_08130 [Microthrixaceae bacterium]
MPSPPHQKSTTPTARTVRATLAVLGTVAALVAYFGRRTPPPSS